jgi:hypothetical protein
MKTRKKPAMRGHSGLSKDDVRFPAEHHQDSPTLIEFQRQARQRLAQAQDLTGASRFAAFALVDHFLRLAGGAHV